MYKVDLEINKYVQCVPKTQYMPDIVTIAFKTPLSKIGEDLYTRYV